MSATTKTTASGSDELLTSLDEGAVSPYTTLDQGSCSLAHEALGTIEGKYQLQHNASGNTYSRDERFALPGGYQLRGHAYAVSWEDISLTAQDSAWEVLNLEPTPSLVTFYPQPLDQAIAQSRKHGGGVGGGGVADVPALGIADD